ncbi:preprotein translocase subunit SecD [Salinigranum rubrum]|uniref:Protein-export membrane protein SecD n=1 Tax=Salinigranum rubrum TaxID=755307 RepID=A0A2I8VP98_9EURY|nr:preprotein translocase subunit SecD [Salinigranum rubrum]AUV83743.1 preprotein translocase subunit SecD [Salinigranum rubrum]
MSGLRDNWRIVLLVIVLLASTFALFSPTVGGAESGNAATEGPTNLKYGLELSGGTRIRAPLIGITAEGVDIGDADTRQVARNVASEIPAADPGDVIVRRTAQSTATVEVTAENVSTQRLASTLDTLGLSYETVRDGVTEPTRAEVVRVLQNKINEAGLSGGTVQQVTTATGAHFILVEVPNEDRSEVVDLVESRGSVRVDIYYRQNGTYTTREGVLTGEDFQNIGTAQESERGPFVPVTVRPEAAAQFQQGVVETGVAQPGGAACTYEENPNATQPCLLVVVDDRVVNSFGMSPGLAQSMRAGDWADDPAFQLTTRNFSEAQRVSINLRAGELPAALDLEGEDGGTSSFISPSQGESFKVDSVITGIIAVLAVAGVVFVRYGEARVALPMIVTAFSEVLILLGFAAGIGYALNLPAIAGFIAVIGTGVDDLIIIADEVMAEGDVSSRRIFQSRFKKAFWVIGAAAATTVIAMSPLAVLSLGDLQGFAIFTILGVLVGVLLTRPAYGDILRVLLTEDR